MLEVCLSKFSYWFATQVRSYVSDVYRDVWGVELWNGTVMNLVAIWFVEYMQDC